MWSNPQVRLTARIMQLAFVCELVFAVSYYIIPTIRMMIYGGVWWNFVGYNLILCAFALSVVIYFGVIHPDSWLSPFFAILLGAIVVVEAYDQYLGELDVLWAFLEIGIALLIISILILYMLITAFIHWGLLAHEAIQNRKKRSISKEERPHTPKKQVIINAVALGVILGSATVIVLNVAEIPLSFGTVTIKPSEKPMELAFWAQMNPDRYTDAQKDAINKHSVLLIPYDTPAWDDTLPARRDQFVAWCNYWKENYTNVRIMPVAHGIPGGFVWDGSAEGTIAFCWRILDTVIAENLTNVIGINTDQESPQNLDQELTYRDRERNDNATKLWNTFFGDVAAKYPNRFEFQTTFGMVSVIDYYDGDNDLDVAVWNNVLTVPGWDEYAPMIYTAGRKNYYSEPLSADKAHFDLYFQMSVLFDVLTRIGTPEKIGVYIGITNMSIMGANNTVYWHNVPKATGYDALVTQGLIAKHFSCRRLTTFILDTVPEEDGDLMGGVFDSYGLDFMDRYNESLNGPDSTTPFEIKAFLSHKDVGKLSKDFVTNPGVGYSMLAAVVVVYVLLVFWQRKYYLRNAETHLKTTSD
jgi:hypothetical protein